MFRRLRHLLFGLSGSLISLTALNIALPTPGFAAEEVAFKYGVFQTSVPVEDLRTFAETQKASRRLKTLLRYAGEDRQTIQQFLQVKAPLNVLAADRLLRSSQGQQFLADAAQATVRRDNEAVTALRGALILAAASPQGLGVLSLLESYPSQRVTLDVPKAIALAKKYTPIIQGIQGVPR